MDVDRPSRKAKLTSILEKLRSNEIVFGIVLAVLIGVVAGFGAIIFRWLIGSFQSLFFGGGARYLSFLSEYYIILIPAIGGLIVGLLVHYGARKPNSQG